MRSMLFSGVTFALLAGQPLTAVTQSRAAETEAATFRRGIEFSAFMPCVQSHGFVRNAYDFDETTKKHYRKYMDLHASLSNVFSRVTRDAAEKGLPPIRPLVFDYPEDTNTWNIADEFLLGDSLLVAPSFTAKPRQDVYLPKGNWKRLTDMEAPVYRKVAGNPIDPGWYADPQIRRYGDTYWVFPTCSQDFGRQTFFDAFSTRDLKSWTKHEKILSTNAVIWVRGAMWAPDAHEKDGKYYLFFSANDSYPVGGKRCDGEPQDEPGLQRYGGIGVAVADRPEGPYRDLIGKPLVDRFWNRAQPIDQYVFKYRCEWYMVYGG